ncbi:type I-F CRISPR-associated endoribonuclease Cas6/Csy4 [Rhodoferax sp.]|uniref:type I-F CRISPR-associated endoribonuclease Cas6/Csy4 n=1 Tax=Rhodoferax sp. TaxID=50421 RepID=UPI0027506415|nr:type I-F CRISPR-associated endoribonuclease Cas6/Csy4 [Rhodoferax sp.]
MDHYVDLRLLPDPEFAQPHLMGALFSKLHRALVEQRGLDIGISFPGVQVAPVALGDLLRLHGDQAALTALMASNWLTGMRDHVRATPVLAVPPKARYRVVSRVQAKSSPERLRRRQMRRHGLDAEQALARVPDSAAERLDLPYVQLRSQSTDQTFRLFIRHGALMDTANAGAFGVYGLSADATIPWF